jgi:hypothetical protein
VFTTVGGAYTGATSGAFMGLVGSMETGLTLTDLLKDELGDKDFNKEKRRYFNNKQLDKYRN